jgi:hypothetical protein
VNGIRSRPAPAKRPPALRRRLAPSARREHDRHLTELSTSHATSRVERDPALVTTGPSATDRRDTTNQTTRHRTRQPAPVTTRTSPAECVPARFAKHRAWPSRHGVDDGRSVSLAAISAQRLPRLAGPATRPMEFDLASTRPGRPQRDETTTVERSSSSPRNQLRGAPVPASPKVIGSRRLEQSASTRIRLHHERQIPPSTRSR